MLLIEEGSGSRNFAFILFITLIIAREERMLKKSSNYFPLKDYANPNINTMNFSVFLLQLVKLITHQLIDSNMLLYLAIGNFIFCKDLNVGLGKCA